MCDRRGWKLSASEIAKMKPDYFDIQLDREGSRYFAGEELNGAVIISINEPVKVHKITVKLIGHGHTGKQITYVWLMC